MKTTYAAPAAATRGDVVSSTLTSKPFGQETSATPFVMGAGGSGLSFGL
jgi:hypothetical protein